MQPMRHEIAKQSGTVTGVFAPPMEMLGAERVARLHRPKPAFPIDIFGEGFLFDLVVPFAAHTIAAVISLTPNQCADFATVDELGALVPTRRCTALRADLIDFAGA